MKFLVDTNVVLNIMLNEVKYYVDSKKVFDMAETGKIAGFISASAITDIYFIACKKIGHKSTLAELKKLLQVFKPAAVTESHIYQALDLDWNDFEDSVQYVVGESFAADYIVTRNTKDYTSGSIPAITPEQFIQAISTNKN